jgi:DNA-binding LacI/PurR family transcriptional regulator
MKNSNEYLYKKVKKQIIEMITEMPLNSRIPTRTELVSRLGVTRTTIDRAISELIGEGYFFSRIGSGTYIINKKEHKPADLTNNTWGIIVPNVSETETYPYIIRAVEDVCSQSDINLIICNTDNNIEKQDKYIKKLIDSSISGAIIVPAINTVFSGRESFELLNDSNIRFVFCNRGEEGIRAPRVVSNDFYGGYIAVNHLLKLGWKRPAFISMPFYHVSEQRYNGYLGALYQYDKEIKEEYIVFEDDYELPDSGYEAMKTMLELQNPPDSVFCHNDEVAKGVFKAIYEKGLKAGEDIGVVGYDDDISICLTLPVKLTTVKFPKYEIGKKAAEILLKMINGEIVQDKYSIVMKPELVVRDSCGEALKNKKH